MTIGLELWDFQSRTINCGDYVFSPSVLQREVKPLLFINKHYILQTKEGKKPEKRKTQACMISQSDCELIFDNRYNYTKNM